MLASFVSARRLYQLYLGEVRVARAGDHPPALATLWLSLARRKKTSESGSVPGGLGTAHRSRKARSLTAPRKGALRPARQISPRGGEGGIVSVRQGQIGGCRPDT